MPQFRIINGPSLHGPDGGIIADEFEFLGGGEWVHFFNYAEEGPNFTVLLLVRSPGMAIVQTRQPLAIDESLMERKSFT